MLRHWQETLRAARIHGIPLRSSSESSLALSGFLPQRLREFRSPRRLRLEREKYRGAASPPEFIRLWRKTLFSTRPARFNESRD
ncbi:MAG: hypothetical protein A2991_02655 [Candidatus Terrybacteria bacterium RIFCSPLOWO2_01_FULL_58_14]|uniref:Uncharacterized protein n=1 Tax=Candidatus Terrybacteria bacterium RIFCSPLOWO2_01_FULL_58_14 TaxID=1802369 RepID=A0A1G2Q0P6_9BACT|nr:MAG: hypothetical protein A2991_02655 [Candidatus Terrybacteria bacterium RIFCSPLOWO2_01_FULL_58_14]